MPAFGVDGAPPLLRAMNLLLNRPAQDIATAAPGPLGPDAHVGAVAAASCSSARISPSPPSRRTRPTPPAEAVDAFLAGRQRDVPDAQPPSARTSACVHHGLTPAVMRGGRLDLMPEAQIVGSRAPGRAGLISLIGVKYTTARRAAERAVDRRLPGHRATAAPCRTAATVAAARGHRGRRRPPDRDAPRAAARSGPRRHRPLDELVRHRGHGHRAIRRSDRSPGARLRRTRPSSRRRSPTRREHAQALRLSDAVLRRTALGSAGHPGRGALECAAERHGAHARMDATSSARRSSPRPRAVSTAATARRTP